MIKKKTGAIHVRQNSSLISMRSYSCDNQSEDEDEISQDNPNRMKQRKTNQADILSKSIIYYPDAQGSFRL
jgi:hypothetical protein